MAENEKTHSKYPALITYILAVICLVIGLVLPLGTKALGAIDFDNMGAIQFIGAFGVLFKANSMPLIEKFSGIYSHNIAFFGTSPFDIGALFLVLYGITTVAAVICLMPISIAGKSSTAAVKAASVMEVISLVVLSLMLMSDMTVMSFSETARAFFGWNLSTVIAFGGTLAALVVQAFVYKGKSGLVKFILLVLSSLAVVFAVFPITKIAPAFAELFADFSASTGMSLGIFNNVYGLDYVYGLFTSPQTLFDTGSPIIMLMEIFLAAAALLAIANYLLDLAGLGKNTKRFMRTANLIRYSLELIFLIALAITAAVNKSNIGLMLYVFIFCAAVALIINIGRCIACRKKVEEELITAPAIAASQPAEPEPEPELEPEPEPEPYKYKAPERPAPKPQPAPKPASYNSQSQPSSAPQSATVTTTTTTDENGTVYETKNIVYNVNTIYNGPTDNFIKKLTNDEKVEFARVFLERRAGNLSAIPDYIIGDDNSKFFSAIFIYFARVRDIVSDGLMNKLYEEVHLMN